MKQKCLLLFVCCLLLIGSAWGQTVPLKGKVVNAQGEPLIGVSIKVKGTGAGTSTDVSGAFVLEHKGAVTLSVSAIGYASKEINIGATQQTINITLDESAMGLDEVVVVGYGTQRRGEVTSSIASVKSEDFVKGTVRDAAQLVAGKVAGLRVTQSSGDPKAATQINLRGLNSISGASQPLILIDGIPGDMNTVAPEDIESMDVLKDGSAAAIYGTRATGGVILITTRKNAGSDRTTIEYSNYVNVQTIARRMKMLDGDDYRRLIGEGVQYEDFGGNTNWLDEILQKPISHNHNLSLFGGNSRTNFVGSLTYRNWEGIMKKTGQDRLTARAEINHSMFDNKLRTNFQIISQTRTSHEGGAGGTADVNRTTNNGGYIYRQAIIRNPTDHIYDENGNWQERDVYNYDNPLSRLNESVNDAEFRETRINGNISYNPIQDLTLKLTLSRVQNNNLEGSATSFQHPSTTKQGLNGTASRYTESNKENLLEFTANYNKNIGDHHFSILGGYSYQDAVNENFYAYNYDFPTDLYSYNNLETGSALARGLGQMSSAKSKWQLAGFFGRVTYNWKEKYLLMASVRREGSSRFGNDQKWGTFPAASIGWMINKESFLENVSAINQLKLRAGFGVTGTIANVPYLSQDSYNFSYDNGAYWGNGWVQGYNPVRNPNPNLRWEKKTEYNVGVDFGLFNNRVTGSLDYYTRKVKDLLYSFRVPVPPYLVPEMWTNAGEMSNKGFEALISIKPIETPTVQWTTNLTFSTNSNKLLALGNDQFQSTADYFDSGATGEPIQVSTHRVQVGQPIGRFFVLKSVGVDDNGRWLIETNDGNVIPIADAKPTDRQYYGNGIPKYLAGWNNSLKVKNFDLSVNIRGAFGHDVLNMQRMYYENPVNKAYNALKTAYDPVYGKQLNTDLAYVSYYIEKGDYVKIDNITLGYTFPKFSKAIQNLRIYASGLNLITITGYKGIDPEAVGYDGDFTFAPGIDNRDKYPSTRTFTFGLSATF